MAEVHLHGQAVGREQRPVIRMKKPKVAVHRTLQVLLCLHQFVLRQMKPADVCIDLGCVEDILLGEILELGFERLQLDLRRSEGTDFDQVEPA